MDWVCGRFVFRRACLTTAGEAHAHSTGPPGSLAALTRLHLHRSSPRRLAQLGMSTAQQAAQRKVFWLLSGRCSTRRSGMGPVADGGAMGEVRREQRLPSGKLQVSRLTSTQLRDRGAKQRRTRPWEQGRPVQPRPTASSVHLPKLRPRQTVRNGVLASGVSGGSRDRAPASSPPADGSRHRRAGVSARASKRTANSSLTHRRPTALWAAAVLAPRASRHLLWTCNGWPWPQPGVRWWLGWLGKLRCEVCESKAPARPACETSADSTSDASEAAGAGATPRGSCAAA